MISKKILQFVNKIKTYKKNNRYCIGIIEKNYNDSVYKDVISIKYFETMKTASNQFITNIYRFEFSNGNYDDIQLVIPSQIRIINKFYSGNFDVKDGFIEGNINLSSPVLKKCL
jgi:hypothetical protein